MAIVHLSKDNFKEEVLESKVPVLVDFWATWCGPCQTMGPLVEEIAEERADIKVCKLDVDQGTGTCKTVPCNVYPDIPCV